MTTANENNAVHGVPFAVTPLELALLSDERNRTTLADLLAKGIQRDAKIGKGDSLNEDIEAPGAKQQMGSQLMNLVEKIRADEKERRIPMLSGDHGIDEDDHDPAVLEADKNAELAANALTTVLLRSSPQNGIDSHELEHRRAVFGSNAFTEKKLESFLKLCWDAS